MALCEICGLETAPYDVRRRLTHADDGTPRWKFFCTEKHAVMWEQAEALTPEAETEDPGGQDDTMSASEARRIAAQRAEEPVTEEEASEAGTTLGRYDPEEQKRGGEEGDADAYPGQTDLISALDTPADDADAAVDPAEAPTPPPDHPKPAKRAPVAARKPRKSTSGPTRRTPRPRKTT